MFLTRPPSPARLSGGKQLCGDHPWSHGQWQDHPAAPVHPGPLQPEERPVQHRGHPATQDRSHQHRPMGGHRTQVHPGQSGGISGWFPGAHSSVTPRLGCPACFTLANQDALLQHEAENTFFFI